MNATSIISNPSPAPVRDEAAQEAVTGTALGGAIGALLGLLLFEMLGPAALAASAVGAYAGSLYGALHGLRPDPAADVSPAAPAPVPVVRTVVVVTRPLAGWH